MRILAVDDDKASLDRIREILNKTIPDGEFYFFDSSLSALAKAREVEIDVAFLDVKMPELTESIWANTLRSLIRTLILYIFRNIPITLTRP